jgi:hypothetical protein
MDTSTFGASIAPVTCGLHNIGSMQYKRDAISMGQRMCENSTYIDKKNNENRREKKQRNRLTDAFGVVVLVPGTPVTDGCGAIKCD